MSDLPVDQRVQAVVVLEESDMEHNDASERERCYCKYEIRVVYLPALYVLCVEQTLTPYGKREGETTLRAFIVREYAAAVRMAVALADEAKAAAKAKAKEEP